MKKLSDKEIELLKWILSTYQTDSQEEQQMLTDIMNKLKGE